LQAPDLHIASHCLDDVGFIEAVPIEIEKAH